MPTADVLITSACGGMLAAFACLLTCRRLLRTPQAVAVLNSPAASLVSAVVGAALCATLAWHVGSHPVLAADCWLAAISPALTAADVLEHRLPNLLTLGSYPVTATLLTVAAVADDDPRALLHSLAASLALGGFYCIVMLASGGGLGTGDVKLATLVGLITGWQGLRVAINAGIAGLLIAGLIGIVVISSGKGSRHTPIPLGPPILAGAMTALLATS
jgi:leader peptidase (prepilin peptidase) / N-methyltransferase